MPESPEEGERVRVLERLASVCDVIAVVLVMMGDEEPAGLAQLLALTLRLADICCRADSKL
ncbi:hypothetical protein [Micromonospora sp. KC721]|uniref:hypothetical protein n=1 Tax=Micromonospora sp. KC721 TaxID=2530380 RepID=UPI001043B59F|nr:hypothetical protein [Micromonospora sp. KC721]TDB78420.1 hypothetical protein E1182_15840 [Micromonospora sp. KC721]